MRVKRFVGDTVAETMGKVKRELGSDAVILQTRQIREGSFLGLFGKVRVEVTAAVEDQPPKAVKLPPQLNPYLTPSGGKEQERPATASFLKSLAEASESVLQNEANEVLQQRLEREGKQGSQPSRASWQKQPEAGSRGAEPLSEPAAPLKAKTGSTGPEQAESAALRQEMETMRQLIESMNHQMTVLSADKRDYPADLVKWADDLMATGLSIPLVNQMMRAGQKEIPAERWLDDKYMKDYFFRQVVKMMPPMAPITLKRDKPSVVALVGPTGVGKTTTIGKLAAGFSIVDRRKIALVTADTYRVAAVEQLKTFGEIIGVPVDVVMTPGDLRETIAKHGDKDLIIVDTAGRSPNHNFHMSELQAFLHRAEPDYTILVLSATTQTADQLKIIERFKEVTTHLLLTKLDETGSVGAIMNIFESVSFPLTYLTTGQNVPDDIEVATPERLAKYVLGEDYDV